ncbi:hypothetical protein OHA37_22285 [Streptomyces sp. NBC_00335]|uniref:hypothetical protein n=1 Tax=unclassified Streptomyces TaxID=2593676 RepID=UPI0022573626|nr:MULTISPECIES: hypothetical protein [unclassified Streptomyces]MCX5406590.1 hypothetical protein [Streptomyces sp. NBC_00086]
MPANALVVTEVLVDESAVDAAVEVWRKHNAAHPVEGRTLYRGLEDNSLLELLPVAGVDAVPALQEEWRTLWTELTPMLATDFRRQVLEFVEAPKSTDDLLPDTKYLQMRHVEVKPPVFEAYREWRDQTIFEVVRGADEVEVFLAYHSVLSTEPGVMFVSGFNVDPAQYTAVFTDERYQEIVRQAGDRYITGGERGLYTKIYARIEG